MPLIQIERETIALIREMHRLRTLGAATKWTDLDRILEGLCGPMQRKKRCERCNDEGKITLGTERKMDCPACGEQPNGT